MQKIITEKIGDKVIILLQEDLDVSDHRLTRRLQSPRQSAQEFSIWIDCSSLACIKAYGFCHFISQLLVLKTYNVSITVLSLSGQQRKLLQLFQLDKAFTVVPDFEDAYQLVQAS